MARPWDGKRYSSDLEIVLKACSIFFNKNTNSEMHRKLNPNAIGKTGKTDMTWISKSETAIKFISESVWLAEAHAANSPLVIVHRNDFVVPASTTKSTKQIVSPIPRQTNTAENRGPKSD
jgi:hypothetical protein